MTLLQNVCTSGHWHDGDLCKAIWSSLSYCILEASFVCLRRTTAQYLQARYHKFRTSSPAVFKSIAALERDRSRSTCTHKGSDCLQPTVIRRLCALDSHSHPILSLPPFKVIALPHMKLMSRAKRIGHQIHWLQATDFKAAPPSACDGHAMYIKMM